jgi:hypothetical protein
MTGPLTITDVGHRKSGKPSSEAALFINHCIKIRTSYLPGWYGSRVEGFPGSGPSSRTPLSLPPACGEAPPR